MNLLISNDDGVFALGIRTLANALATAGHQVTVVCPDRERSATGHGLTLHKPIRAEEIASVFQPDVKAWACSGTPSDCIKLALGALVATPPDFVLSGINHGANLGTDILYSGTVSAAMEGMIEGIPSIAFSLASFTAKDFQPAANFANTLLAQLIEQPLDSPILLNVNIPAVSQSQIKGAMVTRQGLRRYIDLFERRVDPRGKTYYWLAGEVIEEIEPETSDFGGRSQPLNGQEGLESTHYIPTDVEAIKENYITITPLQYNLTSLSGLSHLQMWRESCNGDFKKLNCAIEGSVESTA
ncbi:MAG: 5'/3'-nucleotidase SurE [Leptolyngbyaceae cyanobacterium MO_188.B28]|nr:5'/3'-nucleotidase SurE [Leptolyngbyaceae cyanobacterium MO_188.B28]